MASLVSIVLPTFNRARFLPEAFASILGQSHGQWELILVDDGSTDDTGQVVEQHRQTLEDRLVYVRQENRGAYGARNTGLDLARGDYIAFYDSDDLWMPQYLQTCAEALDAEPTIDWVYAACQSVRADSNAVINPNTFLENGLPRPFLQLQTRRAGTLHVLEDPGAVECQLSTGLYAGLQNSVIRRRVFEGRRFWEDYRVTEDVQFLVRVLASGARLAYIADVHVIYRVHDDNSSASAAGAQPERLLRVFEEQARGLERLKQCVRLSPPERRALDKRLARVYFWHIGYSGCWVLGQTERAFEFYRAGLRLDGRPSMWKTYAACRVRVAVRRLTGRSADAVRG